ncbi:MAG: ornithine carbamoyltransferase [Oscillospiraceae bacterium]|nr:ornithine carbamoyltransferase [Oscillospiraceae bacterium]
MKKDFLLLSRYTLEELSALIDLAAELKAKRKAGKEDKPLEGKTLGMIFEKSSTRTRVSFEAGMYQLGGQALFLSSADIQLGRGEPIEDTARVLSRYLDCLMIRTFEQEKVERLAAYASIPVINGLTDFAHPCQVVADLLTMREYKGNDLTGKTFCYIGDGNNMANSLIVGCLKSGMNVRIACPQGYQPDAGIMQWALENGNFLCTENIREAAAGADVLYTDVWASMGQEGEAKERQRVFQGYQINAETLSYAADDAIVLHCLPAHRGEEITAEVMEAHAAEIFDEAENRLHAHKAILVSLLK